MFCVVEYRVEPGKLLTLLAIDKVNGLGPWLQLIQPSTDVIISESANSNFPASLEKTGSAGFDVTNSAPPREFGPGPVSITVAVAVIDASNVEIKKAVR